MEKVLETGVYCTRCDCIIKDEDLISWECGQCHNTNNWENIEIVMKTKATC